jgi:chorismate dehydratase
MRRLRISAISYLNTAPLMWDFEHSPSREELKQRFDVTYTIPSACAEALRSGTADIGIIPVAAYATIPGLLMLPGVAIAALNAVRSILLVSRKPLHEIKTVALDTSSMTSVALCKVLFAKWLGGAREYQSMAPDLGTMLAACDAALLIGDPALLIQRADFVTIIDLAEEWRKHTGKPFVFAFWAVREQALAETATVSETTADAIRKLAEVFQHSRDHGLAPESVQNIANEWAPRLGTTPEDVTRYLTDSIHYHLDPACWEGLRLFYNLAKEYAVLPKKKLPLCVTANSEPHSNAKVGP